MTNWSRKQIIGLYGIIVFSAVVAIAAPCFSACDFSWKPGQQMPGFQQGEAYAISTWDPDGDGPKQPLLVIGGSLLISSNTGPSMMNIAAWGGTSWQSLDTAPGAISLNGWVTALTVYNGELVAGGFFNQADGVPVNGVAAWNGTSWHGFGNGPGSSVRALTVYNGQLVAAGDDVPLSAWNGSTWQTIGPNQIRALAVYNNQLIAGGWFYFQSDEVDFYGIASWDGTSWHTLGDAVFGGVNALTIYNNELVAGGVCMTAGGVDSGVMRWNGSTWQAVGEVYGVKGLVVYNDKLIAGGDSFWIPYEDLHNIAQWDGSGWHTLGNGTDRPVNTLGVYNNELIAGGGFDTAGDSFVRKIARWNGSMWQGLGNGVSGFGPFRAFTVYNGRLIAGGMDILQTSGMPSGLAWWDGRTAGSSWQPLAGGLSLSDVSALTVYNGSLIASGVFDIAGGGHSYIVRFDGNDWQGFESDLDDLAQSFAAYNGQLIASGYFRHAGGADVNNIASWDGSNWHPLGSGINGGARALAVYDGQLIAGGDFTKAGDMDVNGIARWDGSSWQPLGGGLGGEYPFINAFAIYNNELIAGGWFTNIGGVTADNIARWDGSSWQPVGWGLEPMVTSLTVFNGELIAGGIHANQIWRWDGSIWQPLDWTDGQVDVLTVYNGELIVGGTFESVGSVDSKSWARWGQANPIEGDLNHDCSVDELDLQTLAQQWLKDDCGYTGYCGEADLNYDRTVNFSDYAAMTGNWLMWSDSEMWKWAEALSAMDLIATSIRAYYGEHDCIAPPPVLFADLDIVPSDLDGTYFGRECYSIVSSSCSDGHISYVINCNTANNPRPGPTHPASLVLECLPPNYEAIFRVVSTQ